MNTQSKDFPFIEHSNVQGPWEELCLNHFVTILRAQCFHHYTNSEMHAQREKEICLRSCSPVCQNWICNPHWSGSRTHALELIDKGTDFLTQVWEKVDGKRYVVKRSRLLSELWSPCALAGTFLSKSLHPYSFIFLGNVNSNVDLLAWVMQRETEINNR